MTAMVKCLVWDLDQTLWRGVLLEDGAVVVPDAIRTVVSTLDDRGILQSVASRNDPQDAIGWLQRLGLADYFLMPQIGWGPKSAAIRAIAERLGLAYDTIAFIDDQPAERAEVAFHLPPVRLYAAEDAVALPGLAEFSPSVVTEDSRRRRAMYQTQFQREAARDSFAGSDEDFLRTLELRLGIGRACADDLARVQELTVRTSQMNATGVHYSQEALERMLADPSHRVLVCTLDDRHGPYGAIGILLLTLSASAWHLRLLTTSCRVIPFGVGATLLDWLVNEAASAGVHVVADFRRTDRNRMMEIAYRFAGFADEHCDCLGTPHHADGVQRLHLIAAPRPMRTAIRITAPTLVG